MTRRPSYGPTSPAVGRRGARTRRRILDSMLVLLDEQGFHATVIDDVAGRVGLSRAALYQYFESKEEIFFELLAVSLEALLEVVDQLGPIGPDRDGFTNIVHWLARWTEVHDRYDTVYQEWAHVDSPQTRLRPLVADLALRFRTAMELRITDADLGPVSGGDAAITVLALISRVNYLGRTGLRQGLTDGELLDALATVVQLGLFPATPPSAFAGSGPRPARRSGRPVATRPPRCEVATATGTARDRREGRGPRAQRTIRQLLDAGASVVAQHGYHDASIEEIVARAGLGRGTFYKYFDDKLDLLQVLGREAAAAAPGAWIDYRSMKVEDAPATLRRSIREVVAWHRQFEGIFRAWVVRDPPDPAFQAVGDVLAGRAMRTVEGVVVKSTRLGGLNPRAVALVLLALLERAPDELLIANPHLTHEHAADVVASFIERAVFTHRYQPFAVRPRPAAAD